MEVSYRYWLHVHTFVHVHVPYVVHLVVSSVHVYTGWMVFTYTVDSTLHVYTCICIYCAYLQSFSLHPSLSPLLSLSLPLSLPLTLSLSPSPSLSPLLSISPSPSLSPLLSLSLPLSLPLTLSLSLPLSLPLTLSLPPPHSLCQGTKLWIIMEYLGGGSALDLVRNYIYFTSVSSCTMRYCNDVIMTSLI